MSETSKPTSVRVLEHSTTRCRAWPGKKGTHAFKRTDEARFRDRMGRVCIDGEWEQRVWVCSKCGERAWWW